MKIFLLSSLLWAIYGVGLNSDGTLFLRPEQLAECHGDGEHQESYPNGQKRQKGKCKGGLLHGKWKAWHPNGEKMWEVDFESGKADGSFHSWWEKGEDHVKAKYEHGLLNGKFKSWHPNGKLAAEGELINGQKAGCWETYYDSGEHASKGAYANGNQVKTWLFWDRQQNKRKEKYGGETTQGACAILL